jgi:hypothetical protein
MRNSLDLGCRNGLYEKITNFITFTYIHEELDGSAASALDVRTWKPSNVHKGQSSDGRPKLVISSSSVLRKAR